MSFPNSAKEFLQQLIDEIAKKDRLHSKKINANIDTLSHSQPALYSELVELVRLYFSTRELSTERIATDYLKMIRDMRTEGLYFYKHGKYRCENQKIANEYVYSKPDVMSYYMHALLVSQILWKHHFNIFVHFQQQLKTLFPANAALKILDVGPGHGFFSFIVKKEFPAYSKIDIVDISETSLEMTKRILGTDQGKIKYTLSDIFDYQVSEKYDFIVLGEVIEHLDDPGAILMKLANLMHKEGLLWITTPTNSPALDHVYLFRDKEEVLTLIKNSGLDIVNSCNYFAEDMDEETALRNKVTNLVGLFAKNKAI